MTDPTAEFFHELAQRGHEPLLGKASGTVRFVLDRDGHTDHWLVTIHKGDLTVAELVTEQDGQADAVFHASRTLFDRAVTGQVNGLAAVLRGEASTDGDPQLLVYVWRLFPGPARDRQPTATVERRPA